MPGHSKVKDGEKNVDKMVVNSWRIGSFSVLRSLKCQGRRSNSRFCVYIRVRAQKIERNQARKIQGN